MNYYVATPGKILAKHFVRCFHICTLLLRRRRRRKVLLIAFDLTLLRARSSLTQLRMSSVLSNLSSMAMLSSLFEVVGVVRSYDHRFGATIAWPWVEIYQLSVIVMSSFTDALSSLFIMDTLAKGLHIYLNSIIVVICIVRISKMRIICCFLSLFSTGFNNRLRAYHYRYDKDQTIRDW